ncbi:MAG: hypothetical protein V4714_08555 [Bacteroidota bacterium]
MSKLILFSLGLLIGIVGVGYLAPDFIHPHKWLVFSFLLVLSLGVHLILQWVAKKHPSDWVGYYLGIVVGRLLLSVVFLGYLIFAKTPQLYLLIGNFFVLYLCYTGFEIYSLLANLRRNSIS